MTPPLAELSAVSVDYDGFRALEAASFSIHPGEIVGVVGESGSGKTTALRALMGLTPIASGDIRFDGAPITRLSSRKRRLIWRDMQMIFQDPSTSLSPGQSLAASIAEPMRAHGAGRIEARRRAEHLLDLVGLDETMADRRPDALSGGQRQRVAIARALALEPRLIVADEPMSALDVSIKAQVAALFSQLRSKLDASFLIVSHDLALMSEIADRIVVMRAGRIVEQGPARTVIDAPAEAYTRRLRDACLNPETVARRRFGDGA